MSMMGWASSSDSSKWTSASRASFGKRDKGYPRQLTVLALFLKMGLQDSDGTEAGMLRAAHWPVWDLERHLVPGRANAYSYLNLFGAPRDEEGEMYIDREDRQRVFARKFMPAVRQGVENAKKEAGELGRAGAVLGKVLLEGMGDYNGVDDTQ